MKKKEKEKDKELKPKVKTTKPKKHKHNMPDPIPPEIMYYSAHIYIRHRKTLNKVVKALMKTDLIQFQIEDMFTIDKNKCQYILVFEDQCWCDNLYHITKIIKKYEHKYD